MLNFTNTVEYKSNHNEIPPHISQNVYYQKDNKQQMHYLLDWIGTDMIKTVWWFLKVLKIQLPFHPVISILDIYLKKTKTLIQKDVCTPMFCATLLIVAEIWKQINCLSIDEWIKKTWCIHIHTHTEISLRH